jgi:hypothetical protein|tara:strand:+ start:5090 stop:5446 length:357 start_codon:yes stop_codon:yes gene_type:complete
MVRLTGYVTVAGRKMALNWTITSTGIVEGVGLSSSNIQVHNEEHLLVPPMPSPRSTPAESPSEETDYDSLNKTELQVLCSQRGLSTTGTKADLIARLQEDDAEPTTEGEDDGGEGESE